MGIRDERINKLARINSSKHYLEIGVQAGKTFFSIDVENKSGVDPKFRFDYESLKSDQVKFFKMTSREFFLECQETFDLIYLDGLHTFEQTLEDLLLALSKSLDRTLILIDDTLPTDEFSVYKSHKMTLEKRKELNLSSKAWHGDVFKVVFFISDFLPHYSFATMINGGHGQTVLWKQNRQSMVISSDRDLSSISSATFESLQNNLEKLKPMEDERVYEILFNRFAIEN